VGCRSVVRSSPQHLCRPLEFRVWRCAARTRPPTRPVSSPPDNPRFHRLRRPRRGRWPFIGQWRAHIPAEAVFAGTERGEVAPRLGQAQSAVRPAEHHVGVRVVLPIVLPEAHRADSEARTLGEGQVPAARTCVRAAARASLLGPFQMRHVALEVEAHEAQCARLRSAMRSLRLRQSRLPLVAASEIGTP
jgi:hypothetical protein